MKYTYLDYLSESKVRLYNALGIIGFFSIFSLVIIIISLNQRDLYSYNLVKGQVSQIKMDTILKESEATYSDHSVERSFLVISVDKNEFFLGSQYGDYRKKLLSEIKIGDTIKLYYRDYDRNELMPLQIEKENEILIPFSYFKDKGLNVIMVATIVFIITTTIITLLIFKRMRFLRESEPKR